MIRKMSLEDDGSKVADLICEADENFVKRLFGEIEHGRQILSMLVRQESGIFTYRNIWVNLSADRIDGILLGFDVEKVDGKESEVAYHNCMSEDDYERFADGLKFMDDPAFKPGNEVYILTLAVSEESRRRGIAGNLIHGFMENSRRDGYPNVSLDVDSDKDGSVAFYKKIGFHTSMEIPVSTGQTYLRMRAELK